MGSARGMVRVTHSLKKKRSSGLVKKMKMGERNSGRGMSQGIVVERATEQPWHRETDSKEEGKGQWGLKDCGQTERGRWRRYGRDGWGDRVREMCRGRDKHQARKGESPCNFSNPPGIYTFTRQIMKMKNKMKNFPSCTGGTGFFSPLNLLHCSTLNASVSVCWVSSHIYHIMEDVTQFSLVL